MKVWIDKKGKKLTLKQFIQRWKKGIDKTPLMKKLSKVEGIFDEGKKD